MVISDLISGLFYLVLVSIGLGILVSLPTFLIACSISVGSKMFGNHNTTDKDLDGDLDDISKEFEKTIKEYNITNDTAKGKIFEEILAKKNIVYNSKTKKFERRDK